MVRRYNVLLLVFWVSRGYVVVNGVIVSGEIIVMSVFVGSLLDGRRCMFSGICGGYICAVCCVGALVYFAWRNNLRDMLCLLHRGVGTLTG